MNYKIKILVLASTAMVAAFLAALLPSVRIFSSLTAAILALCSLLYGIAAIIRCIRDIELELRDSQRSAVLALVSELHASQVILNRFPECAIPTTGWSMRFTNVHTILDLLDQFQPDTVVEFGSGISTISVASWLKNRGHGKIISFDHDENWASVTQRHIKINALGNYAKVIVTPLMEINTAELISNWYDLSLHLKSLSEIDFLIIDGPPAGTPDTKLSRAPALPYLHERLSLNCVVVLDDANRPGEKAIIENWSKQFPEFEISMTGGFTGLAILKRPQSVLNMD